MNARDVITLRLAKKIKPVVRFGFLKKPYYVLPEDISFAGYERYGKKMCKARGLYKLATITTKHRKVGYKGAFEPTVEEVLWQIPSKYIERTIAFETKPVESLDDDIPYEIGKTTLYGLKRGKQVPLEVYHADIKFKGVIYNGNDIGRDMEED